MTKIQELRKKGLKDSDDHKSIVTHLQLGILECEVKWALGSIITNKASGGDGISADLFKILKDDGVKVLHVIHQQIWKSQQWPPDWKRSIFIPVPKKDNAKKCSNFLTAALILHPAAAQSLQSWLTLCDPIDGSPPGSAIPGILQAKSWSGLPFPSPMHESEK